MGTKKSDPSFIMTGSRSDDFVDSLRALFEEAGGNGRDAQVEFVHLRSIIIEFVANCARMTSAKARARCNLTFTDGKEPKTILAFTPSKFDLAEKRVQLDAAGTGEEFTNILQTLIDEQKDPRRGPKTKSVNKKRPNTSPPESPGNKAQKRIKWLASGKNKKNASDFLVPNTEQQSYDHIATKPPGNEGTPSKVDPKTTDSMDTDSGLVLSISKSEEMDTQQKPLEENEHQKSASSKPPYDREDTDMEDTPDANAKALPVYCPSYVLEVVAAAKEIAANQWNEFKPKLLEMLGQMHVESTPEEHEAALERLQLAIARTEPERSLIPADTWKMYEKKLIEQTKKGLFDYCWSTRQYRIGRIIYLNEEEAVMESKDWERLRKAARLWAILTETTSRKPAEVVREEADAWLIKKLGDISFLERLFACKKHLGALKGPGEE
ncbi:hypothetical protein F53441_3303 [Fusarium austroafricanum]|uniref:Uncharacterized protein n=1 Tax=Fusarium austroafricanum TaxID=2364996 RepID=A0A8H4KN04_9HYPO|nr:hypothetical protein F53441_3303 [Fusarium austroafricanum]